MNKSRVETISDGVFSIVMTLLVFNITVPTVEGGVTNMQLWSMVGALWPLLVSYALSFLVLSVFWVNHHYLFHTFAKSVDRRLNLLNLVYLMFLAFVPFSAHLVGVYSRNETAVIIYGINILAVMIMTNLMLAYVVRHEDVRSETITPRLLKQARIRTRISTLSYVLGIIASFFFIPLSVALYLFPMIFNIIPGTLDFTERVLSLDFGSSDPVPTTND